MACISKNKIKGGGFRRMQSPKGERQALLAPLNEKQPLKKIQISTFSLIKGSFSL